MQGKGCKRLCRKNYFLKLDFAPYSILWEVSHMCRVPKQIFSNDLKSLPCDNSFFPCCGSKSCLWLQILYRESHQTTLNTILTTEDKRRITLHEETHIQDGESLITLFNMHCSAHHLQKKQKNNNNNLSTMLWLIKKDYKCHFRVSYTQNVAKPCLYFWGFNEWMLCWIRNKSKPNPPSSPAFI